MTDWGQVAELLIATSNDHSVYSTNSRQNTNFSPSTIYYMPSTTIIAQYVKDMRKKYRLTQQDLSEKAGVGLRFVRELEQGKLTLRLDKVNQIFELFGCECGPVPINREALYENL